MTNISKISQKIGLPPGTLIHIGKKRTEKLSIQLFNYDDARYEEIDIKDITTCLPFKDKPSVTWINIDGIHHVDVIDKIGKQFNLHPLLLEDILNTEHRPKIEDYEDYLFFTLKMLNFDKNIHEINYEQVSFVLGKNYLLSFQETTGDVFDPIRKRIREGKGKVRRKKADYLLYLLIDAVVDNYFIVLEELEERSEILEDSILNNPTEESIEIIQQQKKNILFLRKFIMPLREAVSILIKEESKLIERKTFKYLSDVYDNVLSIIETLETHREIASGLMDIYISALSNKMNLIMKVLTIITTIFIPLTFIAGIYGMNFRFMPELELQWGYPAILLIMALITVVMLVFFKGKKWL